MITSEEIKRRLWNGANELRGSMDASRYKDYMLGLMFYKFLSDKALATFRTTAGSTAVSEMELMREYKEAWEAYGHRLTQSIQSVQGYYVLPDYLYQRWLEDINIGDFELQKVIDSLNNFERTIAVSEDSTEFKGLFSSSTLDLTDSALGSNLNERSKNIRALILLFADLNMVELQEGDVLGDAYEYLIGMFAMESGKKAGEFYTPRQVSEVMAQIVTKTPNIISVYDPAVGSGSLLLTVGRHLDEDARKRLDYYGQEKNTATYNLTRMNLLLHGVRPERMNIRNADTLAEDWPEDPDRPGEGVQFDAVVMNPPYSLKNWNRADIKVSDPRFEIAGVLPPSSKGDYAFLLHGLFHLRPSGTMAIVLPHGVLFRGAAEGQIRSRLLDKNYIDTVIGLPANLFTNTGIPVVILVLKKNRPLGEPVLFIDASKHFIKVGKQNALQEKDIAKIVDTYVARTELKGYSHLATREEIIENEYNLNIPRYIESDTLEIPHDVDGHLYGGIPRENLATLEILHSLLPEVLDEALIDVRPGYVKLAKSVDEIGQTALASPVIQDKIETLHQQLDLFIARYWELLRNIQDVSYASDIRASMLDDIKDILNDYRFTNYYDGYQVIAELWKDMLDKDTELIAGSDFYTVCRTREPRLVMKGSGANRREEQDGWIGALIPNELIEEELFRTELEEIEQKQLELNDTETKINELVEAAKVEDSDENNALIDTLKRDANDEPGDDFDGRAVKEELKQVAKGSSEFKLLRQVEKLLAKRTATNREIRLLKKERDKAVEDRILELTDEEIDHLVFNKWFGDLHEEFAALIEAPLRAEIATLEMLNERYSETLDDIDAEIREMEQLIEEMLSEMVVTYE